MTSPTTARAGPGTSTSTGAVIEPDAGTPTDPAALSRRRFLQCGAVAAGVGLLAACGAGGTGGAPSPTSPTGTGPGGTATTPPGSPAPLVALADVPVGGAVPVSTDAGPILVAQPEGGRVVAFSAVCTHMGCTVAPSRADAAQLQCPCHGSTFAAATGENLGGPAPRPLDPFPVSLVDGQVLAG